MVSPPRYQLFLEPSLPPGRGRRETLRPPYLALTFLEPSVVVGDLGNFLVLHETFRDDRPTCYPWVVSSMMGTLGGEGE